MRTTRNYNRVKTQPRFQSEPRWLTPVNTTFNVKGNAETRLIKGFKTTFL